jgi:DNA-binding NarL/FixJ family response regulator
VQPFLLLVDIYMPRMNGLQFLLRLRTEDHLRHHTAVVLTTSDWTHDKARAYSLHAAGYIQKDRIHDLGQFVRRQCAVKTVSVNAVELFNAMSGVAVPC